MAGVLWCFGGKNIKGALRSTEYYELLNRKWKKASSMSVARFALAGTVFKNFIYATGTILIHYLHG